MNGADLLLWVRGPGFDIALAIMVVGLLLRGFEIFGLGRKVNLAEHRAGEMGSGLRTVWSRTFPQPEMWKSSTVKIIAGYVFHLGLFVVIFLFAPHIQLIDSVLGLSWPALPSAVVDAFAAITILAMIVVLANRLSNPVLKYLSGFGDYLAWTVTLLPVLTGYLAFNHLLLPYTTMLALHILSVEVLMVLLPFTKLAHTFTLFAARWYNGAISGVKGVQS